MSIITISGRFKGLFYEDYTMEKSDIEKLNQDLKKALNEKTQIGNSFDGNYKVQVISGGSDKGATVHYLKDDKILLKLKRPQKCPAAISDLEKLNIYKSPDCTENELNILIKWFSQDYVDFSGKTIKGQTNFERLDDEFEGQFAVIIQRAKVLLDALNKREETEELGSKAKELMKSENLRGPFDSVQAFMKSLWDEDD